VRRIGNAENSDVSLPRPVAIGRARLWRRRYAAIKRVGASEVKGVSVMPLAIGFLGLIALLGASRRLGFRGPRGGTRGAGRRLLIEL